MCIYDLSQGLAGIIFVSQLPYTYVYIYIYIYIYIRDVPFWSGLVLSKLGVVPHKTGLFRCQLQPVQSESFAVQISWRFG